MPGSARQRPGTRLRPGRPYNYTSFSGPRDRHPPARPRMMWQTLDQPAPNASPAARRGCSTRCWATSGSRPQSLPRRTTCSTNRDRRGADRRAAHRLRRDREAPRARRRSTQRQGGGAAPPPGAVQPLRALFRRNRRICANASKRAGRHTRRDNICFDGTPASPTSPTPPTGASSIPSWCSTRTPRRRWRRWSKAASNSA